MRSDELINAKQLCESGKFDEAQLALSKINAAKLDQGNYTEFLIQESFVCSRNNKDMQAQILEKALCEGERILSVYIYSLLAFLYADLGNYSKSEYFCNKALEDEDSKKPKMRRKLLKLKQRVCTDPLEKKKIKKQIMMTRQVLCHEKEDAICIGNPKITFESIIENSANEILKSVWRNNFANNINNSKIDNDIKKAHWQRMNGYFDKAEKAYFEILTLFPSNLTAMDGLRIAAKELDHNFVKDVCTHREQNSHLTRQAFKRAFNLLAGAKANKLQNETTIIRTIIQTRIAYLYASELMMYINIFNSIRAKSESLFSFLSSLFLEKDSFLDVFSKLHNPNFFSGNAVKLFFTWKKLTAEDKRICLVTNTLRIGQSRREFPMLVKIAEAILRELPFKVEAKLIRETWQYFEYDKDMLIAYLDAAIIQKDKETAYLIQNKLSQLGALSKTKARECSDKLRGDEAKSASRNSVPTISNPFWDGTARSPVDALARSIIRPVGNRQ